MKRTRKWAAVALTMTLTAMACGSDNETSNTPEFTKTEEVTTPGEEDSVINRIALTTSERRLVDGSNDFTFNLFREVFSPGKSIVLSPLSVTYALGMLANGANGATRQQMTDVLGFADNGADGINAFCKKMLTDAPQLDKAVEVLIANTIFLNKGYELLPSFVSKARENYDATPETRDFADGKTLDVINQWASDHTKGMIEKILTTDEFNVECVSYLLNAIYFKGVWSSPFEKDATSEETFTPGDGSAAKMLPMMHQQQEYGYAENNVCQAVRMPYGNGNFSMTILLPREGKSTADVLQQLDAKAWKDSYSSMPLTDVDLKMPRFETTTNGGEGNLVEPMKRLGMTLPFSAHDADFSMFCSVPTFIEMLKQAARIRVDEEGSEAAAVTIVGMLEEAIAPDLQKPVIRVHANRPFVYVISEHTSGAIFFIGQYAG